MINNYIDNNPNRLRAVEEDTRIHSIFGHIVEIASIDEEDQYLVLVLPEGAILSAEFYAAFLPLEDRPDILASNYGTPRDLIGRRVRIDYYGLDWTKGLARIITNRRVESPGNTIEMPARSFRFAVAGGGAV